MKKIFVLFVLACSLGHSAIAQNTPEDLGRKLIQSFIHQEEGEFYNLIPTCDEIMIYIKDIQLPLTDEDVVSFKSSCPVMTTQFKDVYLENYKGGLRRGIVWSEVEIDEITSSRFQVDGFSFEMTRVNIVAHYEDKLIEITINNVFQANGLWRLNDDVVFEF